MSFAAVARPRRLVSRSAPRVFDAVRFLVDFEGMVFL